MNQLEKMNQIYEKVKAVIIHDYDNSEEAIDFVKSEFVDKLAESLELYFPFQYSSEGEGIYYFNSVDSFKEYLVERLNDEDVISSDDYYESSEDEWQSSSC